MKFNLPENLVNAGRICLNQFAKIQLIQAEARQVVLDAASINLGKAAISKFGGTYGKAIAFVVEPLRDINRHILARRTKQVAGENPGTIGEHFHNIWGTIKRHLPNFRNAVVAAQAARPSSSPRASKALQPHLSL